MSSIVGRRPKTSTRNTERLVSSVSAGGLTWRHVRTPDGKEGYVPAQYTAEAN